MTRKTVIGLAVLAVVALAVPRPAAAHVSVAIGLPGFGLFVGVPSPPLVGYSPPVAYGPPVVYGPSVYYRPSTIYAPVPRYVRGHGHHRGWHERGYHRNCAD